MSKAWENISGPFSRPLADGPFRGHLEDVKMWSERLAKALGAFDAAQTPETAEKCVGAFAMAISNLENYMNHPGDFEKALSDKTIMNGIVTATEGIRSKVLPFLQERKKAETESRVIARAEKAIQYVTDMLLRAEIYGASRKEHGHEQS